jgi:hypothetical protein
MKSPFSLSNPWADLNETSYVYHSARGHNSGTININWLPEPIVVKRRMCIVPSNRGDSLIAAHPPWQ